ncbi:TadE/TadG family type IV pilus assembly protein [Thauera humireducens]|uniref:TadE/TadG family type IV pilus assembly protein n=1 Tax=Thauera humireducens TaxID=1134435 RepID=UPI0024A98BA6|nr:TadE/TadG family type IV pilus assembly protein [Thauera humireducens]
MTAHGSPRRQHGAAAIEFAAVFVVFFLFFYAIVGYYLPLMIMATYEEVAADALRAAIRQDFRRLDATEQAAELARAETRALREIRTAWLPEAWAVPCDGYGGHFLRVANGNREWSVCLRHTAPQTIMPQLSLLGATIPALPGELRGEAKIRLYN